MYKNCLLKSICYKKVKFKKGEKNFETVFLWKTKPRWFVCFPNNLKRKVLKMTTNYISPNLLYRLKANIRKNGETISRTNFCKTCGFLNCNTLRNLDSMQKGVITQEDHSEYVFINKKVHYTVEAACNYLDRLFGTPETTQSK